MYIVCLFLYGWLLLLFEMFYFKSFIKVARFFVTNCFVYVESFSSVWSIRCVFFFSQRGLEAGWLPINQPDQYQWGEGKRFVVNKIFSNFLMPRPFIVCHWQKKKGLFLLVTHRKFSWNLVVCFTDHYISCPECQCCRTDIHTHTQTHARPDGSVATSELCWTPLQGQSLEIAIWSVITRAVVHFKSPSVCREIQATHAPAPGTLSLP